MDHTDLRIIKSKSNIRVAFFELLKEKPDCSFSIKDICEKALCSRNTFYLHYKNKEDLIDNIFDEFIEKIASFFSSKHDLINSGSIESCRAVLDESIDLLDANSEQLRQIIDSDLEAQFASKLLYGILRVMIGDIKEKNRKLAYSNRCQLIIKYSASAYVGFIFHYIENPINPQEAKDILWELSSRMFNPKVL